MWLLDTNVISELFKSQPAAQVAKWYYRADPEKLFVTSISKAESYLGCALLPAGKRQEALGALLHEFYEQRLLTPVLPFGPDEAEHFAWIVARRRSLGRKIGEFDAQIAAIARSHGLAVVTRNVRDFEECGVVVIDPWQSA